jgi:hypothetical protein
MQLDDGRRGDGPPIAARQRTYGGDETMLGTAKIEQFIPGKGLVAGAQHPAYDDVSWLPADV